MTGPMRTLLTSLGAAALVVGLAACGGDDDSPAQGAPSQDSDTADDSSGGGDTDTADDSEDGQQANGPAGARVVVGDQEFVATNQVSCIEMAGAFSAYFLTDDETTSIDISLPPEDWETDTQSSWDPPGVRVDVGDEFQFVAGFDELDSELDSPDGDGPHSAIASFDIGDGHAQGTASFVDNFELFAGTDTPEVVEGSFDVTCADG